MESLDADLNKEEAAINITPLVDVSLVLVLIFLVASPFFSKNLLPVRLPDAVTADAETSENITISLSSDGQIAVNEVPMDRRALEQDLHRRIRSTGIKYVLIRADEAVPYRDVDALMKMARAEGASRIAFATVPKF